MATILLQWVVVLFDAVAAVMAVHKMMSPEARAFRFPMAAAVVAFTITAAFHTGIWRPQEWSDTVTLLVTVLAASFIVHEALIWFSLLKRDGE